LARGRRWNARYASLGALRSNRKNLFLTYSIICGPGFRFGDGEEFRNLSSDLLFLLAQPRFGVIPVERFRIG